MVKKVQENISKPSNSPKEEESSEIKAPLSQTLG
jgi:hypothetical protein